MVRLLGSSGGRVVSSRLPPEVSASLRIAFFGSDAFAVPSLRALANAEHEVALVVTNPDRRRGRSKRLLPTPVKEEAERLGAPVLQPEGRPRRECAERIEASGALLGVVVAYGQFLSKRVRTAPSLGYSINLHGSLLPRWRGAAPVAAAILAGDATTGVSVQRVEKRMDAGPLLLSRSEAIGPEETRGVLRDRLSAIGGDLLVEALRRIEAGEASFTAQDEAAVTQAAKLDKGDGLLDLCRPAAELDRRIRACTPWPTAYLELPAGRLQVLRARILDGVGDPGTVLARSAEGLALATGDGALELLEVKPVGKRAMSAAAYANGRRLRAGDGLGSR